MSFSAGLHNSLHSNGQVNAFFFGSLINSSDRKFVLLWLAVLLTLKVSPGYLYQTRRCNIVIIILRIEISSVACIVYIASIQFLELRKFFLLAESIC